MPAIRGERVGVRFYFDRHGKAVTPGLARLRRRGADAWGLHDASFSVGPGEGVALIGASGSGKTTLLRLLASVYVPDAGRLAVEGRVASLLSVEAGLLSALTGRENAALLGVLAGLSRSAARAALDDVKARSQLGDWFERPVLAYSQGMRARLGLAVADEADPQVLILDEVHEALDHEFRGVLQRRARRILDTGGIVVAAGHDHPVLEALCSRALWLSRGRIVRDGEFTEVQRAYLDAA